jgi:hypothetical protein
VVTAFAGQGIDGRTGAVLGIAGQEEALYQLHVSHLLEHGLDVGKGFEGIVEPAGLEAGQIIVGEQVAEDG